MNSECNCLRHWFELRPFSQPADEIGKEDDTGYEIEFFGGGAGDFAEVCGQFREGHFFEEDMPKQALPS